MKDLHSTRKNFLTENKKHFETLLLKTKHVDKVVDSLKFHPGNRGHIIYTIKQFFNNEYDKKSSQLDKFGVFQPINSDADKQTYGIKDVFKELGINKAEEKAKEKAMLEELDKKLRNSNFSKDTETTNEEMKGLVKAIEK